MQHKTNTNNTNNTTRKNKKGSSSHTKSSRNHQVFSKKDYKSNDGMLVSIWGPGMWHFLHTMSFNYPIEPSEEDKHHYKDFIESLGNILPCGKCRENYKHNMKDVPILMKHMKSRDSFSRYVYDLHEHINKMLGKKSGLTYDEVRERYEHFRARCTENTESSKGKESGCTTPLYGKKAKCVLKIVPQETECDTMTIESSCMKRKVTV